MVMAYTGHYPTLPITVGNYENIVFAAHLNRNETVIFVTVALKTLRCTIRCNLYIPSNLFTVELSQNCNQDTFFYFGNIAMEVVM